MPSWGFGTEGAPDVVGIHFLRYVSFWLRFSSIFRGSRPQRALIARVVSTSISTPRSGGLCLFLVLIEPSDGTGVIWITTGRVVDTGVFVFKAGTLILLVLIAGILGIALYRQRNTIGQHARAFIDHEKELRKMDKEWWNWPEPTQKPNEGSPWTLHRWRISQVNLPLSSSGILCQAGLQNHAKNVCHAIRPFSSTTSNSSLNLIKRHLWRTTGQNFAGRLRNSYSSFVCLLLPSTLFCCFLYLGVVLARTSVGREAFRRARRFLSSRYRFSRILFPSLIIIHP